MLHGKHIYISFITELELLGFKDITVREEKQVAALLADCLVISMNTDIKKKYIDIRKKYKLKLPDAIIAATSYRVKHPFDFC